MTTYLLIIGETIAISLIDHLHTTWGAVSTSRLDSLVSAVYKWNPNTLDETLVPGGSFMGLLNDVEKIAGAIAAVEGVRKLDPNASILTEGAAAVAGFEGAKAIEEHIEKKEEEGTEQGGQG